MHVTVVTTRGKNQLPRRLKQLQNTANKIDLALKKYIRTKQDLQKQTIVHSSFKFMESKKYAPNIDKILKYLNEQIENLMSGNPKLQQKAINAFVKQITIYKTHIDIELIIDDGNVDSDKVSGGGARLTISLSVNLPY